MTKFSQQNQQYMHSNNLKKFREGDHCKKSKTSSSKHVYIPRDIHNSNLKILIACIFWFILQSMKVIYFNRHLSSGQNKIELLKFLKQL